MRERRELRHYVVAELGRVRHVRGESLDAASALPDRRQVRRTEVRASRPEIGVARRAARAREDRGACDRVLVVLEALALRPGGHGLHHLARERLLRGRSLVGEHAHREDDQYGGDDTPRRTTRYRCKPISAKIRPGISSMCIE